MTLHPHVVLLLLLLPELLMLLHLHPGLIDMTDAINFEALGFHMADRFIRLAPTSPLPFA